MAYICSTLGLFISYLGDILSVKSAIEWTDATWNPVTGCTKVSPGCAHCYAEAITLRFARGGPYLPGQATINFHYDRLRLPLTWKSPKRIFVNSMSDLFHEDVPLEFIREVFKVMSQAHWHIFQVLTKRHQRLESLAHELDWPPNVWVGVSVENQVID
jgi:protein gp37